MSDFLSRRSAFFAGVKGISPILLGVVPFAMISGVAAIDVGIPPLSAFIMSILVFAGASQLAALELMGKHGLPLVIVLTGIIVNLRFCMYSAGLAPHFRHLSSKWKALCAYLLTDQAFLFFVTHVNRSKPNKHSHWFYLGIATTMWSVWQTGTAAGIFLGSQVPDSWSLDFAVPLTFLSLMVPAVKDRASKAAAASAGITAIVAASLPFNLGLITATCIGISVGLLVEGMKGGKHDSDGN